MVYEHIRLDREGAYATVTMDCPERRNALSRAHMTELIDAFRTVGASDALGVTLAANGPVFCAGHDFRRHDRRRPARIAQPAAAVCRAGTADAAHPAGGDRPRARPGHGGGLPTGGDLRPGGGGRECRLRAARRQRRLVLPHAAGGAGACGRPQAGARDGFHRRCDRCRHGAVVGAAQPCRACRILHAQTQDLLARATRGTAFAKGMGKQCFYEQIDLDLPKAYAHAVEVMAATGVTPEAQERMLAFVETRTPRPVGKGRQPRAAE